MPLFAAKHISCVVVYCMRLKKKMKRVLLVCGFFSPPLQSTPKQLKNGEEQSGRERKHIQREKSSSDSGNDSICCRSIHVFACVSVRMYVPKWNELALVHLLSCHNFYYNLVELKEFVHSKWYYTIWAMSNVLIARQYTNHICIYLNLIILNQNQITKMHRYPTVLFYSSFCLHNHKIGILFF